MSAILTRERSSSSLALAMPLAAPSVDAAWAFLSDLVPPTVLSSGSGRQRRTRETAVALGRTSEQGYLVFYRQRDPDRAPEVVALKSPRSIKAYLQAQLGEQADQWVSLQTTQFWARRDGSTTADGFTTAQARHILAITVDLDGSRMAPMYRQLLTEQPYAFTAALDEVMDAVGIESYRIVRSGPEGVHLYVPLIRPDGKPLRATEKTLADWERVAKGLSRYLARLGADANAVKATQPFVIPGLHRQKHAGWIPYVAGSRDGARVDLYALLRRLAARRLVPAKGRASASPLPSVAHMDVQAIIGDIRSKAAGVSRGARNQVAHDIAVYLIAKGATETAAWDALMTWNERNDPVLSEKELRDCFDSALRCPDRHPAKFAEMRRAPWVRLRRLLELPTEAPAGFIKGGRWRPRTPAKSWELRKLNGGREHYHEVEERLMAQVQAQGGTWELTQGELSELLGTAISTLKEVLRRLQSKGRLEVQTRRGRGGRTVLTLPASFSQLNSQSSLAPNGVKQGEWVGPVADDPPVPVDNTGDQVHVAVALPAGGPWALLRQVTLQYLGVDLRDFVWPPLGVIWVAGVGWRVVGTSERGREILRELNRSGGLVEWRELLDVLASRGVDP